jgi:hypothetical protein
MSSNGALFTDTSALIFGDDSIVSWPLGDVARVQLVRHVVSDSEAALAWAGAAMARVECEIDRLWYGSMQADDRAMAQRLAEVSHALHRAARLLEDDDAIG